MEDDGTLVLWLTTQEPIRAHAVVRYPKGHQQYDYILHHVTPIKPGETKPVPAFPEPAT